MNQHSKLSSPTSTDTFLTVAQVMASLDQYAAMSIVPTGFPELDALLGGGFRAGQPYTLAAGTGQGKTSLACQIASQHAAGGGLAIIWTLEMDDHHVLARMLAQLADKPSNDVLRGRMPESERERYVAELDRVRFCSDPNVSKFESAAVEMAATADDSPCLIIVDYLQKLASAGANFREAVTQASERLRILAKRLNAPLLIVSAVSREAARHIRAARDLHPSELVDVCRETGAIEYDNAGILVLGLDAIEEGERQTAVLSVAKNRFGSLGQIELEFEGASGCFTEMGKLASKRQRREAQRRAKILEAVASADRPLTKTGILDAVGGRKQAVFRSIDRMVRERQLDHTGTGYMIGRDVDAAPDDLDNPDTSRLLDEGDSIELDEMPDWLDAPPLTDEDGPPDMGPDDRR